MNRTALIALVMLLSSLQAHAQSLRLRLNQLQTKPKAESPWSSNLRYGALSDFADNRTPRAYTNTLGFSTTYKMDPNWSVSGEASLGSEFVGGQIDKSSQQTYSETLNPSTSLELDYESRLDESGDAYTLFVHGEPLLDEPSRREGYQGLVGGGGGLQFSFFGKAYSMSHSLDVTSILNSYKYASDGSANPDYATTYHMVNAIRFWGNNRIAYSFGVKATRYLDGFVGYRYSNDFSLSHSWQRFTMALAYDNGGFTDNGDVSLWYLDQYRRVVRVMANYAF